MKTLQRLLIFSLLPILSGNLFAQDVKDAADGSDKSDMVDYVPGNACKAEFSANPDSLTNFPYYYHFKDLSAGNINIWHWDFGDGTSSTEQNPSHQYEEQGNYTICLTVANINDPVGCNDKFCLEVTTLDYFSLGGLVYAGEYPLNNPAITGDTGIASLYRIVNDQIVFVEDHFFQEYGYYWFGYLFPGDYMLKIGLTPGSPHYQDYFSTYFGDDIYWTKADLISISATNIFDAEIHLKPVRLLPEGQGVISGYVKFEQGNAYSMPPVSNTTVILMDMDKQPMVFTQPNADGYFEFKGVPFDSYFLTADATGKPASTVTLTLTGNDPVVDGINLTVFGSNANFIADEFDMAISVVQIYPNPIRDDLFFKFYSHISTGTKIRIMDITGKYYYNFTRKLEAGFTQISLPAAHLPAGVYLLILQPEGLYRPVMAKFIK
jgi:hypothetical protein